MKKCTTTWMGIIDQLEYIEQILLHFQEYSIIRTLISVREIENSRRVPSHRQRRAASCRFKTGFESVA
jgi:hypothetical protein